ncbi:MAG: hypothetical protein ACRCZZ_08755, partial [Phocaeicola sp.]
TGSGNSKSIRSNTQAPENSSKTGHLMLDFLIESPLMYKIMYIEIKDSESRKQASAGFMNIDAYYDTSPTEVDKITAEYLGNKQCKIAFNGDFFVYTLEKDTYK